MLRFASLLCCFCLSVFPQTPRIAVYPQVLTLASAAGSDPTLQPIVISPDAPTAAWKASPSAGWLTLSATTGVGFSTITASADTSGLPPGVYSGAVRVEASDGGLLPGSVIVTLRIGFPRNPAPRAEWHVTVDGSALGDGSIDHPWDIVTALDGPQQVQPGDTIWLHDGKYGSGAFDAIIASHLVGTISAPIIVRAWPGDRVIIDAWLQVGCCDQAGDPTKGAYTWLWGIEFAGYNPDRHAGSSGPPDYGRDANHAAVDAWGPGTRIINCIVHDTSSGIEMWDEAADAEAYGNLVYNVGGYAADRGHGHGLYLQNAGPAFKRVVDNITFNNFGEGVQMYGSLQSYVQNFHVEGSVSFNNGAPGLGNNTANGTPAAGARNDNLIIGAGNGGPNGILLLSNFTYHTPLADDGSNELGYSSTPRAGNLTAIGNYFIGGGEAVDLFRWDSVLFRDNTVYAANLTETSLALRDDQSPTGYVYDYNHYYGSGKFTVAAGCNVSPCPKQQRAVDFDGWRTAAQLDTNSTFVQGRPTGVWAFVRPNLYEPGRANIVIYNWDLFSNAVVDVQLAGIRIGDTYQIRDAQNWFAGPIAGGVYLGGPVTIPMTGLTAAPPNGDVPHPQPHTCPQFGVFVVVSGPAANDF